MRKSLIALSIGAAVLAGCSHSPSTMPQLPDTAVPSANLSSKSFFAFYPDVRPGFAPIQMVVGPDKNLWYSDDFDSAIGRITTSGAITKYPADSRFVIANGPSGALWFVARHQCALGRMSTDGSIKYFPNSFCNITGLVLGSDKNEWFTDWGSDTIGNMTSTGTVKDYPLPGGANRFPRGITEGPDGNIWFVSTDLSGGHNRVGKITTTGAITQYPLPYACTSIYGNILTSPILTGQDKHVWISAVCSSHNAMVRFTTAGSETVYPVAKSMSGMTVGLDGQIWGSDNREITEFNTTTHIQSAGIQLPLFQGHMTRATNLVAGPDGDMWFTVMGPPEYIGVYQRR